jgi:hypothetical protein
MLSEDFIQTCIIKYCSHHPILSLDVFHIPNGGYRHPIEAKKLKRMGVKKGVSDLFLSYPNETYYGMWQEVKTEKGVLSVEQENFLFRKREQGYACEVVRTVQESMDFFISYLDNRYKPITTLKYRM